MTALFQSPNEDYPYSDQTLMAWLFGPTMLFQSPNEDYPYSDAIA